MDEQTKQAALAELMTEAKASRTLLRRLEIVAFWLVAPLIARLPAKLAYGIACRRGDLISRYWPEEPAIFVSNLRQILGETVSQAEAERLSREALRAGSCEIIDIMRLRSRTRPLRKLVEIRGLEHLEAAIAEGKGAILCTAHYGSYDSAFSLIHASGFPVTAIGHWWWDYMPGISPSVQRFWHWAHSRRLLRYRQRPNIEPWSAGIMAAMQAVATLRRNEVVTICSDAFQIEDDKTRSAKVPFLGREATFMPGVINLARRTGAPILMMFAYRSEDYRHQVVEISPPLSMEGDPETAFRRCAAAMEAAIKTNPALWHFWGETDRGLIELGVIPAASSPGSVPVA
jgi:Kdo2-lipid IVA lauroyltransferase/acyltransferase